MRTRAKFPPRRFEPKLSALGWMLGLDSEGARQWASEQTRATDGPATAEQGTFGVREPRSPALVQEGGGRLEVVLELAEGTPLVGEDLLRAEAAHRRDGCIYNAAGMYCMMGLGRDHRSLARP